MWRALALATLLMTPIAVAGLDESTFSARSLGAVAILGVFGTGIARSLQATLVARAGAPRASVVGYLVPVVAVLLGVVVLGETMSTGEVVGLALVMSGAFLGSRHIRYAR